MRLNPYLMFNGQCEEAFKFYEQCFGGHINGMMTFKEAPSDSMPESLPPGWENKIMHVSLSLDGQELMGSDSPPNYYEKVQGFSVSLNVDDPEKAKRIFQALADGGAVKMPLQQTFWAALFGMVVDRFGTPWMINVDQPA